LTTFELLHGGKVIRAEIEEMPNQEAIARVDGSLLRVRYLGREENTLHFSIDGKTLTVEYVDEAPGKITLEVSGERLEFYTGSGISRPEAKSTELVLKSPLPGRVIDVKVLVGQRVKTGDPLLVMESMKMETIIRADRTSVVSNISVQKGEFVKKGQVLITFE
jgi:biotin carboxyl carrier protein